MSRTFRDTCATDAEIVRSPDYWGETCTYQPEGGEARSVVAIVDESATQPDEGDKAEILQTIQVFVSRDSEEGIDAPKLGEKLWIERDHLEDGTPDASKSYSYAGIFDEADRDNWTLTFTRKRPFEIGGNRKR